MTNSQIQELTKNGYRITSRAHGILSRIDREDWKEFMWRINPSYKDLSEERLADQYRRVYSRDKIQVNLGLIRRFKSSSR